MREAPRDDSARWDAAGFGYRTVLHRIIRTDRSAYFARMVAPCFEDVSPFARPFYVYSICRLCCAMWWIWMVAKNSGKRQRDVKHEDCEHEKPTGGDGGDGDGKAKCRGMARRKQKRNMDQILGINYSDSASSWK